LTHSYRITLTPLREKQHGLEAIQFTAHTDGHADKCWTLSPYKVAALLAETFEMAEVAAIEGELHAMKHVLLKGEYSPLQLAEMGYRLTKDSGS
jgi:hypothetical protein